MSRMCPDCHVALELRTFEGVQIDACPRCAGIFFDDGEVARIKERGLDRLDALEDAVLPTTTVEANPETCRICPNCGTGMDKFRYMYNSDLFLDECERCGGIWVQDGELRRMREVLEKSSRPSSVNVTRATKAAPNPPAERVGRIQRFLVALGR